jgi:transposase-like protein
MLGSEQVSADLLQQVHWRNGGICPRADIEQHNKPPVFILTDQGTGQRYVIPVRAVDESTIRLLLAVGQQESLTVYTDGFRAYEPLEEDNAFGREYVV